MDTVKLMLISALEKVFPDEEPAAYPEGLALSGLKNETISFQAAFMGCFEDPYRRDMVSLKIDSPLTPYIRVRRVRCVPVGMAIMPDADENYLRRTPGLYPDLLEAEGASTFRVMPGTWSSAWIDIECESGLPAGTFPVTVTLVNEEGVTLASASREVTVIDAELPPQTFIHTKWFHSDCLATYYGVEVFSEEYWRIVENFIACAVKHGINMILTPIHTPPLDTRIGSERPTVQLVDVFVKGGVYSFGFEKLERWVDMCKRCGAKYYEMAHLFTQWGCHFTPKIMAEVDGEKKRIFGWDVPAGEEYGRFLSAYLPALTAELEKLGIDKVTRFHISDEPSITHLESYSLAKSLAEPYLKGYIIMDALSDYEFYKRGLVLNPVCATNHIEPFLENRVPGLWAYYCIGQYKDVSNTFMAMPGARTRVIGIQLYKFAIEGLLQWGYNFWFSQYSDYPVDPHLVTDADGFGPSGDAFQVYPGPGGIPEESVRMMTAAEGFADMRALQLLESLAGREFVLGLIDEGLTQPVTFSQYPHDAAWLLALRERVNREIAARLG